MDTSSEKLSQNYFMSILKVQYEYSNQLDIQLKECYKDSDGHNIDVKPDKVHLINHFIKKVVTEKREIDEDASSSTQVDNSATEAIHNEDYSGPVELNRNLFDTRVQLVKFNNQDGQWR